MRARWLWIALALLAVLGCLARQPGAVVFRVPIAGPQVTAAGAAGAPVEPHIGYLDVQVRWPGQDLRGFRAASIPQTTRALAITILSGGDVWAGPVIASRTAGTGLPSFSRIRVREADNLSIEVKAFREPEPVLGGASASTVIATATKAGVNVRGGATTALDITLAALFVPSIESFGTNIAPAGDTITLKGKNLGPVEDQVPAITWGGVPAAGVEAISATELHVKVPEGAKTGAVVVTSDGLSSAADEDIFWVVDGLNLAAASASWDPSRGLARIVLVGESLELRPQPTFVGLPKDATPGPGVPNPAEWPRKVHYTLGNSAAGQVSDDAHSFTAGPSVATTSLTAAIGSLASATTLTVSVEKVESLALMPATASLEVAATGSRTIQFGAVAKLSRGATNSLATFTSSDPATLSIDAATGLATAKDPCSAGLVTITGTSKLTTSVKATATVDVLGVGASSNPTFCGELVMQGFETIDLGLPVSASIEVPGDVDYYKFVVSSAATVHGYTTGTTDTVCYFLDAEGNSLGSDDQSGPGDNCWVSANVLPGTYFFKVHDYYDYGTGTYSAYVCQSARLIAA